ncbi:hypothetical protein PALB_25930 [Pseudoalteromonas luteoviolacea B = ATCC 29581]|nr:hypothetical protein PALB_25930 [Pseudoalteromonas luteoviolacea B = ATCC 29581]
MVVAAIIATFWMSRVVADAAKVHAEHQAQKLNVQLLSVSLSRFRLGLLRSGKPGIKAQFAFEFSADGNSVYQGQLHLENEQLVNVEIPPHRLG